MSRRRSVLLVSALTFTGAAAAGCEPRPVADAPESSTRVYASKEECAGEWDQASCEAGFEQAKTDHLATAPQYASREACEAQHDCQEHPTHTGVFMPIMMGYMMGRMMGAPMMGRPLYMDRAGASYSGQTRVADPGTGVRGMPPRTVNAGFGPDGRVTPRSSTTRGGFGATSSYRGSAGG